MSEYKYSLSGQYSSDTSSWITLLHIKIKDTANRRLYFRFNVPKEAKDKFDCAVRFNFDLIVPLVGEKVVKGISILNAGNHFKIGYVGALSDKAKDIEIMFRSRNGKDKFTVEDLFIELEDYKVVRQ